MTRIHCSQRLWRRLGYPGQPPRMCSHEEKPVFGLSLGAWAATVFRLEGKELVMALNERTYLTLVFPSASAGSFLPSFASALSNGLTDLSISASTVQAQAAAIQFASLELLYHDDLRRVQLNLNEVPHANRDLTCRASRSGGC